MGLDFRDLKFARIAKEIAKEIVEFLSGEMQEGFRMYPREDRITFALKQSFNAFGTQFTRVHVIARSKGFEIALMDSARMLFFQLNSISYWFKDGIFAAEIPLEGEMLERARKNEQFDSFLQFLAFKSEELSKRLEEA